ncbi:phosphotransferase [Planctomonas sp. JC2975]|uniref:phosphotransferase family protein n=1 Tax=Planctomonas sp. JC2975 TaxID=2729626 RepID=UPI001473C8E0|nr:phosphotransferase [Planctomonas sp. JC2975]NNC11444.1 phosphotransferase [Planctomonas sp. JC2975]
MELIAQGRSADVYEVERGRVLRRYRSDIDAGLEARVMLHLEERGFPVPHVFDADGTDLVMERVDGGTLFEALLHEPGQYRRYGRLLGELHERLHRLDAPAWLGSVSAGQVGGADISGTDGARGLDGGYVARRVIVHRDLHPQNVILSERGPVVIDWTDVGAGTAAMDTAITVILTLGAELEAPAEVVERIEPFRALFVDAYLETCGADPRDGLDEAIAFRALNPSNTATEAAWLRASAPRCLDSYFLEPRAV